MRFLRNASFYALGGIFIAFGVVFMLRSNMGLSTWDTLHYSLTNLFGIEMGDATIYVALFFTLLIIVLNRDIKYLIMAIPIFGVGILINVINLHVMVDFEPVSLVARILSYLFGLSLLPFGGSLLIISTFPAGVFDEFNLTLMRLLKSNNLVLVRVIMEVTAVLTAFILGAIAGDAIGMINIGTIIFSLTVGLFLKTYLTLFERIGLYEFEQND
jgi:uncharacterized membrane protein YczE